MLNDFCAFILTHGRPDNVITYGTLLKHGYTGPIYIVIDNEDKTAARYYEVFGNKVIMFDKLAVAQSIDEGDNFDDRRAIIYARNACFDIARKLGYTYFIELDDDYTDFRFKQNEQYEIINKRDIRNLDKIFSNLLRYYKKINALSIAIGQGGDFIGGVNCSTYDGILRPLRKCMNSFICSTERSFIFSGRINEDVNTYVNLGSRGGYSLLYPI